MMHYQKNGQLFKCGVTVFSALLFILCRGETQVGPTQQIVATVGKSAVLPCYLETPVDDMVVEWGRPDLSPGWVHVWRNNKEILDFKQPSYTGRTSLLINKLKHGDVSLKLSRVRVSDEGTYRCFIPALGQESFVELIVGSVSTPSIEVISDIGGRLVLQCESKGWYPEPELLWLDAEGKILSAGPTETVRGPDDLYTVSSRVTVEDSDTITCRVQQSKINQIRETRIVVKFYFTSDPDFTTLLIIAAVCITLIFICLWKVTRGWRSSTSSSFTQKKIFKC
ncbi:butyrophilin subfamily 2 member A2-like isoform X2 [Anabas testudineus]|uniref:butyrophilin subfamily 2 member A2-like isoform X2 n=1 Tax=Anabas testudineus TaxID=64144 RepID=UPI00143D895E|nr:butyrophilin subfamily 2 member A2-like isoform X2 [Anabas testudineus]